MAQSSLFLPPFEDCLMSCLSSQLQYMSYISFSFLDLDLSASWHSFSYFTSSLVIFQFQSVSALKSYYNERGTTFCIQVIYFSSFQSQMNFDYSLRYLFRTQFSFWARRASFTLRYQSIQFLLLVKSWSLVLLPFSTYQSSWCLEAMIISCICKAYSAFIQVFIYFQNRCLSSQSSHTLTNLPDLGCLRFFRMWSLQDTKLQNPLKQIKKYQFFFFITFLLQTLHASPPYNCTSYVYQSDFFLVGATISDYFFSVRKFFRAWVFFFFSFTICDDQNSTDLLVNFDGAG